MTTTLLLNASFEPLRVISWKRAVLLVLQEKAEVLEEDEEPLRSASSELRMPKVIRLLRFVKVPFRATVPLTKRSLLARDNHRCAYCKRHNASTIDHVIPRSRGGEHRWENVVAACSRCNSDKDDRLLSELHGPRWELDFTPHAPKGTVWLLLGVTERSEAWEPYLQTA